jgi:hypothetical protein
MENEWFAGSDENYWKIINIMDRHKIKKKVGLWKRK